MEKEEKEGKQDGRPKMKESSSGGNRAQGDRPYPPDWHNHYDELNRPRRRKICYQQGSSVQYRDRGNHLVRPSYTPYQRAWNTHGAHPSNRYETKEGRWNGPEMYPRSNEEYERQEPHFYKSEKYGVKAKRNGSPSKAIGVFGLGAYITEDDVKGFLREKISEITNYRVVIVYDKYNGMSKGYGFIQFDTVDDAITAKNRLVGQTIKGKEIRVDYSIE
ncbi:putative nucleolar transformer 2-like protein [Encephalitozoon intestinalis ATCC 50506]|uniref:Nucleolar transformer 2-like protein n=1 Tax=Encephalitozoon intestinalis (strain ATCC 50506) TaxID=876142 RepID=E0S7E3_ENCIT|nr:putative nucleolar transformer 2-like protein [Encephalitozoon intestinalis ATCC 50506]ADM11622.1 putative nucleolar transformer 2-like protein [Encephalitozoon intestinalis ATCC 50506]UTX45353.1 RRM domain-containing protein [Encephalitozoon intestinalis]